MALVVSRQLKYKTMILVFICVYFVSQAVGELSIIDNVVTIQDLDEDNKHNKGSYQSGIQVETEQGLVRGYQDEAGIVTFFDIPYGEFSKEQPFQEPTPSKPWEAVHDKTSHSSRCPQIRDGTYEGSHECLTLTVMKPKDAASADVLFHIHDNSFTSGSGDPLVYNPKHIVPKGVILVLPNYRLGPLGFLCLQNNTVPGNAGLKDLTLALNWTKSNIESFGGNSTNIVVSGAGAGGALVEYLLLNNNSNIYISKAITESGSVLSPWAIDRYPLDTANQLFQNLRGHETIEDPQYILQNVDLEVLTRAGEGIDFKPCIESDGFMTQSPWVLLQNGKFKFSYMTGSANQAAMGEVLDLTTQKLSQINQNLSKLLPKDLFFDNDKEKSRLALKVKTMYFGDNDISENNRDKLSLCYSDSQYLNSAIRTARLLAKGGSHVYFYEFSLDNNSSPINGSARGDSMNLIFGTGETTTDNDEQTNKNIMREMMINIWISFIKYGNPSAGNITWKNLKYGDHNSEEWLSIGSAVEMRKGLHVERLKLWDDLYNSYYIERNKGSGHKPVGFLVIVSWSVLAFLKL